MKLKSKFNELYEEKLDVNLFYLVPFFAVIFLEFILSTTFNAFFPLKLIDWLIYLFLLPAVFKIFFLDQNLPWQSFVKAVVLIIALISWRKTSSNVLLIMTVMVLAAKTIDFDLIIKCYFKALVSLLSLVMIYSLLGVIKNLVYFRNSTYRYSFGLDYPTNFAALIFSLCLAFCYLHFQKLNWKNYLAFVILAAFVSKFNNARLDTILILLIIPVIEIAQRAQKGKKKCQLISSFYWMSMPIMCFIAISSTYFFTYTNRFYIKADDLFSGRLHIGKIAFMKYGYTFLGQKIIENGWGSSKGFNLMKNAAYKYFFIDSAYIRLVVIYGIILGILLLGAVITISVRETRRKEFALPAIFLLLSISALIDQHILDLMYDPFLIALLAMHQSQTEVRHEFI